MNKSELAAAMAEKSALSKKDSEKAISAFIDAVTDALKEGDKVQLIGFGTFEVKEIAERQGFNPRNNEKITIPAQKKPKFTAGKSFKENIQ